MALHVLYLPDYTPPSLNTVMGHWTARHRLKKQDRKLVATYAMIQKIPHAHDKRSVSLRVVLAKGQRAIDPDNAWKTLLDSLKYTSLIVNDSPKYCQPKDVTYLRSGTDLKETYVILEDV